MIFFRRRKLLHRLIFIALLIALLPLTLAGIHFIHNATKETETAAHQRLENQADLLADFFSAQYLANWNEFLLILQGTYFKSHNLTFCQEFIRNLLPSVPAYGAIQRIELFKTSASRSGQIVYESPSYRHFFQSGALQRFLINAAQKQAQDLVVSRIYYSNLDSSPNVLLTRLSSDPHSHQDLFVLTVNLDPVVEGLQNYVIQRGWEAEFVLWDGLQQSVCASDIPLSHNEIQRRRQVIFASPMSSSAFGTYRYKSTIGQIWLGSLANVSAAPAWKLSLEIPRQQAIRAISKLRFSFYLLLLFGVLIAVVGAVYYWKKIADPIDRFTKSATEIARGDFSQKVKIDTDDEIGRLAKIFNYMVLELRRLHDMDLNKIISERTKTQIIIRNIADGVIVTDVQDHIVVLNSAVERWFHVKENQVSEKPIHDVIGNAELSRLLEEIKETHLEGTFTREIAVQLPEQSNDVVFQAKATRLYSREDELMGVVVVLRDITQEKEVDRMKTDLVSLVAHELRSPLTSISGFGELLMSTATENDTTAEYARIIKQESDRLAALVNKFLDLARIEAGRMDFNPAKINLTELIESLLYFATVQAQEKGTKIDIHLPVEAVEIYADEKMISEVVLNLLSNAVKYSPPNSEVELRLEERSDEVTLGIVDHGYGIAEGHLPHIFEKFYRIKEVEELRGEKGTGLGLALVKEIVELHHGRIEVKSEVGEGSVFGIILPKNLSHEQDVLKAGFKLVENSQRDSR